MLILNIFMLMLQIKTRNIEEKLIRFLKTCLQRSKAEEVNLKK